MCFLNDAFETLEKAGALKNMSATDRILKEAQMKDTKQMQSDIKQLKETVKILPQMQETINKIWDKLTITDEEKNMLVGRGLKSFLKSKWGKWSIIGGIIILIIFGWAFAIVADYVIDNRKSIAETIEIAGGINQTTNIER